jgi:hypothetical protein
MTPYPYTVSSAADLAKVAECLVRLAHSGILVDEVLHLMLLTLAKVWAAPPGRADSVDTDAVHSRVSLGRTVTFCGASVTRLIKYAVALGVSSIPVVFQLACEPHWMALNEQQRISEQSNSVDEAVATLPEVLISTRMHTSDALVSCITHALQSCKLPLPFKVCLF